MEKSGDPVEMSARHVEPGEGEKDQDGREDEERAGGDTSFGTVKSPAEVGGELLGLRAGKQHGEIQRVEEMLVGKPALLLDELPVHDGNLAGGSTEADPPEFPPESERREERRHFLGVGMISSGIAIQESGL